MLFVWLTTLILLMLSIVAPGAINCGSRYLRLPLGGGLHVADFDEMQWRFWRISDKDEEFIRQPFMRGRGTLLYYYYY